MRWFRKKNFIKKEYLITKKVIFGSIDQRLHSLADQNHASIVVAKKYGDELIFLTTQQSIEMGHQDLYDNEQERLAEIEKIGRMKFSKSLS